MIVFCHCEEEEEVVVVVVIAGESLWERLDRKGVMVSFVVGRWFHTKW